MNVLVCVKRVPSPGSRIVLTDDGMSVDTQHLGFTVSPHEECAVEEAVRIVEQHGGSSTVLTLGPDAAEEQLRTAISMGANDGVLLPIADQEWDPQATAAAITGAVRTLEEEGGTFDLILFGDESADAGHHQVGIRVAHALGRPIVAGIKAIAFGEDSVTVDRDVSDGFEIHELPRPAVVAVKEGINLPRYPAMRGRLRAAKAQLRRMEPEAVPGGLTTLRLHHPVQQETETVVLGQGAAATAAVVSLFEEMGLV